VKEAARIDVFIDGVKSGETIVAPPGKWTPVLADLPLDRASVTIEERLQIGRDSPVLWGDDRISPNASSRRPDVILITLDTTRPDYLTPYASHETSTPTLAQLAREGTRFDQAISVSSWTMPAHAALMTGEFPDIDLGFGKRLEPSELTLAEIFSSAGYNVHGASGGPYTDSTFGFQQGFRSYLDSGEWKNAHDITDWALERVTKSKRGAPLFLFLNYFDAHEPYPGITSADWARIDAGRGKVTPATLALLKAGYRAGLHTIDLQINRLFDAVKRTRDWQNTVVIVVGDHGSCWASMD